MPSESSSYAHTYLPQLRAYQDELLQRLETLVNIDSGTGQVTGVNTIMAHLKQWLSDIGFRVTLHPTELFGNNLVARREGSGHKRILLVGHVDTVYAAGAAQLQPFAIRDGIAYGPGVIDMKSGVLMGLYVLRTLLESGFEQFGELCVVFNNDEEVSSPGSTPLIRDVARGVDVGMVLEPSRAPDIITHARKGTDKYMLEVTGISAHSGAEPHKGRSAVVELAHKILAINNLNALYPGVTFNVTRLSSTEPLNIVPDKARCHISVRAHTGKELSTAAKALEQIAASCNVPDTHTTLTHTPGRRPYRATPEVMQLVAAAQAEGAALDLRVISESKGGVSDANTLMEVGIPTLDSLGPCGGNMHNLQLEHLHVASLPLRGAMLAGLIRHVCEA